MPRECLPDHLKHEHHKDWRWPLCYIPRAWTSWCRGRHFGYPPELLRGNCWTGKQGIWVYPKPIPQPGQWQLSSPFYFAFTTKAGWHFRFGCRYDDVDFYYTVPSLALKRIE